MSAAARERAPLCVLLLPRELDAFVQREQAEDLLRAPGVVAVDPPRLPYGAYGRVPGGVGDALAAAQARRLLRALRRRRGEPRVVVIFHPLQYPLARALIGRSPGAELWYGRWDRYERALRRRRRDADPARGAARAAAQRSELTFVASDELVRLERDAGREAVLATNPRRLVPRPDPAGTVVAVSLGHLGRRNDWRLLRAVADELGDRLVLLLIGAVVRRGVRGGRRLPRVPRAPEPRLARAAQRRGGGAADPHRRRRDRPVQRRAVQRRRPAEPDPQVRPAGPADGQPRARRRAHLGAGRDVRGLDRTAFAAALLEQAGARARPDAELREWALRQHAASQNAPLWERLEQLGIARRRDDARLGAGDVDADAAVAAGEGRSRGRARSCVGLAPAAKP